MALSVFKLSLAATLSVALLAFAGVPAWTEDVPPPAAHIPSAPALTNSGFECAQGYSPQPGVQGQIPNGWTALRLAGNPELNSARVYFTGSCANTAFVEHLEGEDSMVFLSEDIETPPLPGKPFDAVIYQQTAVTPGVTYSLSGWMVSLCGGSAAPSDCPQGHYIAKMLGIDPTGGVNPLAPSVIWVEDLRNFTESRWANLRLAVAAQTNSITVFGRIRSPFQWHGAHAFVDAFSLVQAPTAQFVNLPSAVPGAQVTVRWQGSLGPDIPAIPNGSYQLLFDVQQRPVGQTAWRDWQVGQAAGQAVFAAGCLATPAVEFRLRARAEQPEGGNGAWPNHRYPGVWSQPVSVTFNNPITCTPNAYLPLVSIR
jgi:hypothetical protein